MPPSFTGRRQSIVNSPAVNSAACMLLDAPMRVIPDAPSLLHFRGGKAPPKSCDMVTRRSRMRKVKMARANEQEDEDVDELDGGVDFSMQEQKVEANIEVAEYFRAPLQTALDDNGNRS
ncbi:hypothetical protein R1sor_022554 [Riccia sorocarpa]|uniref:Uncharacterized protein n=1 Tax=Riccia sorocarpa TaxID=122646 RepID=A0ABD3GKW1_9MARC